MLIVRRALFCVSALTAVACSSGPRPGESGAPPAVFATDEGDVAPDLERRGAAAARDALTDPDLLPDPESESRVLAWVNDEVVTYRDVLLEVGPELAVMPPGEDRLQRERTALIGILRDRIVYHAAKEAGVELSREELDELREARVAEIARNGGTLELFLAERGMTRREFEREIVRTTVMERYLRSAMGMGGGDPRVRPLIDPYVSPGEVKSFYERNPKVFHVPEHARIRVMAVPAERNTQSREAALAAARMRAESARRRLLSGEDWVPVYRETAPEMATTDPYGLLEVIPGKQAPWIDQFAFSAAPGTVSEAIQQGDAYYVLMQLGAVPESQLAYDEVHEKIRRMLGEMKRELGGYEVELRLLEQASVRPVDRADDLRRLLDDARENVVTQYGL